MKKKMIQKKMSEAGGDKVQEGKFEDSRVKQERRVQKHEFIEEMAAEQKKKEDMNPKPVTGTCAMPGDVGYSSVGGELAVGIVVGIVRLVSCPELNMKVGWGLSPALVDTRSRLRVSLASRKPSGPTLLLIRKCQRMSLWTVMIARLMGVRTSR